jgi:hypothetical protein
MLRKMLAIVLSGSLALSGCASVARTRMAQAQLPASPSDNTRALIADYVQKLPLGTRVRVERVHAGDVRGTLMKASPDAVVVQRNTRVPEPPVEIPLEQVTRISVDEGRTGLGKAIGIGAAVGVGATFGVLMLLAALLRD